MLAAGGDGGPDILVPSDADQMRVAMRDYWIARRRYLTADAATRTQLQATMTAAAASVAALAAAHGLTALPSNMTGNGGLMQALGMPDSKATDGIGGTFIINATIGVVARGADATGGTDDDM